MTKKQTPITAEEIIRQPKYNELKNLILICEAMDEFAQAKVLEALEREVVKFSKHAFKEAKAAVIWSNDYPLHVAKNYIETEVKQR